MEVPSNNLSPRDEELFRAIISRCKSGLIEDEAKTWNELLTKEERSNKNRIKNRLFKTTERYLAMRQLENTKPLWNLLLLRWYMENNIRKTARTLLKRIIPKLSGRRMRNIEYPLFLSWMYDIELFYEREKRKQDRKILLSEQALNEFYAYQKMRLLCEKANRNRIVNDYRVADEFEKEAQKLLELSDSPLLKAYFWVFRMIAKDSDEDFSNLDAFLTGPGENLENPYLKEFYLNAMNFCIRKSNQGEDKYARKYLDYIADLESKNMLLDNGILVASRLKNVITVSLMIDRLELAEDFMNRNAGFLSVSKTLDPEDFLELNRAIIELHKGNIDECMEGIRRFRDSAMYHRDMFHKISCDKLLLKAYYEKGDIQAVQHQLASIKNYIQSRDNLKKEKKDLYLAIFPFFDHMLANNGIVPDLDRSKLTIPDLIWLKKMEKRSDDQRHS